MLTDGWKNKGRVFARAPRSVYARPMAPVRIAFTYEHPAEEEMVRELVHHLTPLQRSGTIEFWARYLIGAGEASEAHTTRELDQADIIIALVTSRYLSLCEEELSRSIARQKTDGIRVIPIRLRPAGWEGTPLDGLEPLPEKGKAVVDWQKRDKVWVNIAGHIKQAAQRCQKESSLAAERDRLKEEIAHLQTQAEQRERDKQYLVDKNIELGRMLSSCEYDKRTLGDQNDTLKKDNASLRKENAALREDNAALREETQRQRHLLDSLDDTYGWRRAR